MNDISPSSVFSLHDADPQPGLILDGIGTVLQGNRAARDLCRIADLASAHKLLPINAQALVHAALEQGRAIENVEARTPSDLAGTILMWTFIPDVATSRVLARARDATQDVLTQEEATRSNRLYRLITENTTDLISRHAPDGRFIDATPASWRLLGYWPEELRGKPLEEVFRGNQVAQKRRKPGICSGMTATPP